ncbi:MAG: hypothetical protein OFPII_13430 [Osedax symbiont Rs1]|nr:MAG: hypothetical protein OFPII_13430 [Osedax symbiont Rs1]
MSDSKAPGKTSPKGAQQFSPSASDRRRHKLQHHREVARDSLRQLLRSPIATFMTVLVLAIALALPSFLFTTLANVSRLADSWDSENKISLYLQVGMSDQQVENFVQKLLIREDLVAIDLIDAEQGLLEFKQFSGFSEIIDSLPANLLPAVVSVLAKDPSTAGLEALKMELQTMQQVDQAVLDLDWVKRFNAILLVVERIVIALSIILACAVLLIIGNTIRVNVESRRDEILVSKLMGATNDWVRRPFLYTGVFYAVVAAGVAWVIIELTLIMLQTPVLQLSQLYNSQFQLQGLGALGSLVLFLISLLLGTVAALISVNKFLNQLEPQ